MPSSRCTYTRFRSGTTPSIHDEQEHAGPYWDQHFANFEIQVFKLKRKEKKCISRGFCRELRRTWSPTAAETARGVPPGCCRAPGASEDSLAIFEDRIEQKRIKKNKRKALEKKCCSAAAAGEAQPSPRSDAGPPPQPVHAASPARRPKMYSNVSFSSIYLF